MTFEWGSDGFINVNGKQLEYYSYGPQPELAPTLVLLHEGLGCCKLWRDFPQKLVERTGFGVFVFSRAGYGNSEPADLPRPLDYMTREALDVLPVLIEAAGIKRSILLGHSDGATIAAIYAGSLFDPRIRGLVLMAPHFFTEPIGLEAIKQAKTEFELGELRAKLGKYHKDPVNAFRGWNDSWLDPQFKAWDVSEVIDYIRVPILAVQGLQDQYGTLAQIEIMEKRSYAPVEPLILDDCRHSPFLDQAEKLLDGIGEFCMRLERMETSALEGVAGGEGA